MSHGSEEHPPAFPMPLVRLLARVIDLRLGLDPHASHRMALLTRDLGRAMGQEGKALRDTVCASLLHNLGLVGLPDELLQKPYSALEGEEKKRYDAAPLVAETLLLGAPGLEQVAHLIRHQYEWYNGNGYPDGLFGDRIPLGSRILAVTGDYEELQSGHYFGETISREEALDQIRNGAGSHYDPEVVERFLEVLGQQPTLEVTVRELRLPVEELQPGMVLSRPLETRDGTVLLGSGQRLEARQIERLRDLEQRLKERFILHVKPL